jgi:hypothetical protein
MRFMVMHKNQPDTEAGVPPTPELVAKMGAHIGQYIERGVFLGGEGLGASKLRTRLTFRGGACTVKHGPYGGERELPCAALLLTVRTRDEAIGWAERYGKILGDGALELGPVTEPWDLGFGSKPADAPLRVLLLDNFPESPPRTTAQKAALTRLKTEMSKAGILVSSEQLQPSTNAKRLTYRDGVRTQLLDGPFVESKELIGGFTLLELSSFDEAIAICDPFAAILGGPLEIDIRLVE